ncbi:SURF1 family protein [Rhizobium sp. KVB221]|uniref:SURF1-like protein n=1 Tax=Rhizobium setariae TaxID=2801340 RepID=A0A936YL44_9HYPH|nr:SURF1 family protein [Rhizobium setariae]MBL0372355.1 SURF1 family protein [Rhizobium setariae]
MIDAHPSRQRSHLLTATICSLLLLLTAVFIALGAWQLERLSWKLDLISRIDTRIHAEPVAPPSGSEWAASKPADVEYRRVRVSGTFDNSKETYVYASTERGAGYWVITPLMLADSSSILINRGFVPTASRDPISRPNGQPTGPVTINGLLRLPEPGGTFIRSNDPVNDRWYSRDVAAIADKRGIALIAPYFIDADSAPNPGGLPVGGLTVVTFRNNHQVYALTWFVLAAMVAAAAAYLIATERHARRS